MEPTPNQDLFLNCNEMTCPARRFVFFKITDQKGLERNECTQIKPYISLSIQQEILSFLKKKKLMRKLSWMSKVEVNWSSKADWHSCLDLESLMFGVFVSSASLSIVCSNSTKLFDIVTFSALPSAQTQMFLRTKKGLKSGLRHFIVKVESV